jgi:REP element-mobilizing transposase RayT
MIEKREIRRYRRFQGYDYSRGAAMFITIVVEPRRPLFGAIRDARLVKTPLGEAVARRLREIGEFPGIRLFNSVVMTDHVHLQLHLRAGLAEPLTTLGRAIGRFKSLCAKDYHEICGESGSLWQQGYHDWLCQSKEMIAAVNRYIDYNPLKYELRWNQPEYLAIHEPLAAWRLSTDEFWRGIGAVELLNCETPMVALRISRKLSARQIDEAVRRIQAKIGDYVFIGGWISPGEKAIRDLLLGDPRGKIIEILPSAIPHDYKVGSMWLEAIRDRRAAIIARGNSEVEFSRAACLDLNAEAAKISQGQALATGQPGGLSRSRGLAHATVEPGGETAGQALATVERGGLSRSRGLAHATVEPGGETAARPGWAVYWKASGPEVVS